MRLIRFDEKILDSVKSMADFYKAIGVDFEDDHLFGERASVSNVVMHPETDEKLHKRLSDTYGTPGQLDWLAYSPVTTGSRYKDVEDAVGRIIRNVLYIVEPTDELYKEV